MGGEKKSAKVLNEGLLWLVDFLRKVGVPNQDWFVSYGTLLGLHRDKSCIEGDDDIDVLVCDEWYKPLLRAVARMDPKEGAFVAAGSPQPSWLRFELANGCPIDLYMGARGPSGNLHDPWNQVLWSRVLPSQAMKWRGKTLQVPRHLEDKLRAAYGETWRVPQSRKRNMDFFMY